MLPLVMLALSAAGAGPPIDFALKDGDTVVFLGDSITAARTYGKHVENYTLLRYPDRIRAIVAAVRAAVPAELPVSAKLRLGWDDMGAVHTNAEQRGGRHVRVERDDL